MGLGDYNYALAMRQVIQDMFASQLDEERPRAQYATVSTIDRTNRKATVTFLGEVTPTPVNMGSTQPMSVGQTVRVAGLRGDRYIDDVLGPVYVDNVRQKWINRGQFMCTHGGYKKCDATTIFWSGRFLFLGQGTNTQLAGYVAGGGFFEITYPTTGTVIPKYSLKISNDGLNYLTTAGDTSITVGAGSITLGNWETLWYVAPWGTSAATTNSSNFRITTYINTEYVVPDDWIMICHRNGDTGVVKWADGINTDYLHAFSYINSYADWTDANYAPAGYRRVEDEIHFSGLVGGTGGTGVFTTMPVGYRPTTGTIFTIWSSTGARELRVDSSGSAYFAAVLATGNWASLGGVFYRIGA